MQQQQAYLQQASRQQQIHKRLWRVILCLSLVAVLCVFWGLKMTGITLAGEAFCGHDEHVHGPECQALICELVEDEAHAHTDACYESVCALEEHTHVAACYSDLTADLETEADWEQSLGAIDRECSTADQVVQVATSQLGVAESERNFEVDAHGVRRGITRYGQWYGNPYGDWSAMFASFCLHYAGAEGLPANAGPESMRLEWEKAGLYQSRSEETPQVGNLLFLNMESPENNIEPRATFVAVITKVEDGIVTAIAGDVDGRVEEIAFAVDVPRIIGYGMVPDVSGYVPEIQPPDRAPGQTRYIWLDGTCGGLMSLGGSDNTRYTAAEGSNLTLPTQWKSPDKYHYVLRGWYDISNNKYYEAGATMTVTGNAVLYADWMAADYDVGEFNEHVDSHTLDTNDFITTRVFDYNILFNILSERVNITQLNESGHKETWSMITSGKNNYNGESTLNYIFRDWDDPNEFSWPSGADEGTANYPTGGGVYEGLYTDTIRELLFNPEVQTIGKNYLGEGNYLFQLCQNKDHDHYGDYYYNSERNAASYNQSDQRFYVYDYLECTRTSSREDDEGKYSDFLPFNSPYKNTNGKTLNTYQFAGIDGQHTGKTHYMYDCRYDDNENLTSLVGTNFLFGMSVEIRFYLPNKPGSKLPDGTYGNIDAYNDQMHFRFGGDDDVWVFLDGKMVLDLGGLHGREEGEINFSTGEVMVNGVVHKTYSDVLKSFNNGEHVLTLYYLERGSSMSNCSIYFNLAPRYEFNIYKEDVVTGELLNGSEFSVYMDAECTVPAQLWNSYAEKKSGAPATNVFTVKNGKATMWGICSGMTYYIRETKPPDTGHYGMPHGIISLTFLKKDVYSYREELLPDSGGLSPGFTIHDFRVDNEALVAHVYITNGEQWINETTSITTKKRWADDKNHDDHLVTVYLTITDRDGTVRRLQAERLYSANNWEVTWDNLPKYWEDGVTPIQYGVEEAYSEGYYGHVEEQEGEFVITHAEWVDKSTFEDGVEYILCNPSGQCLSTQQYANDTGYKWVSEEEAQTSDLALWTASVKNGTVRLTNRRGQIITFYYNNGSPTDFFASTAQGENNTVRQYFTFVQTGSGLVLHYNNRYLAPSMNDVGKFGFLYDQRNPAGQQTNALHLTPSTFVNMTERIPIEGEEGYMLTNVPLDKETSVTVRKEWDIPPDMDESIYEQAKVTIKLFANGKDTGRTVTLTLKNGWMDTFLGLPYEDADGQVIVYTIQEVWKADGWSVSYGDMTTNGRDIPIYGITVTNTYHTSGPPLPTTGSPARLLFTVCGLTLMLIPLIVGFGLRRKRERRRE